MKSSYKKLFSFFMILFILISLVYPSYQIDHTQDFAENGIMPCVGTLYLECLCPVKELGVFNDSVTRHIFQSIRRHHPKAISLGFWIEPEEVVRTVEASNDLFVGIGFVAVLMIIVTYIFRTDGKKRILINN